MINLLSKKSFRRNLTIAELTAQLNDPNHCINSWIDIQAPSEEEYVFLTEYFKFDENTILECKDSEHYPKIEDYENYLFFVTFALSKSQTGNEYYSTEELNIYLGKNYIVTVHRNPLPFLEQIQNWTQKSKVFFSGGTAYILEEILDSLVHTYFPVLESFDDKIDYLENALLQDADSERIQEIFELKKKLMYLRKLILPQQEMLFRLSHHQHDLIDDKNRLLMRNVYDHFGRLSTNIDSYRDLIAALLEAFRSQVSNKLNEVMKILTIFSTIFMPLTLLVGYYGMNFEHIAEFKWPFAIPLLWLFMGFIVVAMLNYFRKKKWL